MKKYVSNGPFVPKTTLMVNNSYEGETIEEKVRRITQQGEPITDGAPLIYPDKKEGVLPEHDIRTDRWEIATDLMDLKHKNSAAKRTSPGKTGETADAEPKAGEGTPPTPPTKGGE